MSLPYLSVLYTEPDASTYKGVQVVLGNKGVIINSGDPILDYLCTLLSVPSEWHEAGFMCSSSVDSFIMDGGTLEHEDGEYSQEEIDRARAFLTEHEGSLA